MLKLNQRGVVTVMITLTGSFVALLVIGVNALFAVGGMLFAAVCVYVWLWIFGKLLRR